MEERMKSKATERALSSSRLSHTGIKRAFDLLRKGTPGSGEREVLQRRVNCVLGDGMIV